MKFTQLSENLSPRSYDPPPSCDPDEDPPYTIEQLNLVSSFSVFTNHIIPQFNCRAEKSSHRRISDQYWAIHLKHQQQHSYVNV